MTLNPDGSFVYTPAANFNGADSFTYMANDGTLDSAEATVAITVTAVNDAPVAKNDELLDQRGQQLTVAAAGRSGERYGRRGRCADGHARHGPSHGTLTLNPDGSFVYTPAANFNGSDSFTYKANDGKLDSAEATVAITVTAVNDAPVARNDEYTTSVDTSLMIAAAGVLVNDTDAEGGMLGAIKVTDPAHGTVTLRGDGSFSYTPDAGFTGDDTFTYKASDGKEYSDPATITITVSPLANRLHKPTTMSTSWTRTRPWLCRLEVSWRTTRIRTAT